MEQPQSAPMRRDFDSRAALVEYLRAQFPQAAARDAHIAHIRGGRAAALAQLAKIEPSRYAKTRNYIDGDVSYLSPYIRHGVLSLAEVRDAALRKTSPAKAEKFINELCWRDYWQRVYRVIGDGIWQDIEPYKTGFSASQYAQALPADIRRGETDSEAINHMIAELYETGYLHNHMRMYLAAYVVHWRRVRWQAGAAWFLEHLLDGDPASNNLSWQWVASTFSSKPYIFDQANLDRFMGNFRGGSAPYPQFEGGYEGIAARLFPHGQGSSGAPSKLKDQLRRVTFTSRTRGDDMTFKRPLLWIHGDNLHPQSPALTEYVGAPAVWTWDEALLDQYQIALKRIVFMYECLLEIPTDIYKGNVYPQLIASAHEHDVDGIVTMDSPSPRFREILRTLEKQIPVKILQPAPLVDYDGHYDLRRFSRYWEVAQTYAFGN